MTFEMILLLIIIVLMFAALIMELSRPHIIVMIAFAAVIVTGLISPQEALKGFSNEGLLTIALLFVMAGVVQQTGYIPQLINTIFGKSKRPRTLLVRMASSVTAISAFMNNTPIVVMLLADIRKWCIERGISPSKFLIPLSYASIFGGMITLIGTSTNLVVHGQMIAHGMEGMSMFQLTAIGLPAAIVAILYLATIGYRLLPDRAPRENDYTAQSREYLCEAVVEEGAIVGKTVEEAGLRNLKGLYLIEIIRGEEKIVPVSASQKLQAHDRLVFTGVVDTIVELQQMDGLHIDTDSEITLDDLNNGQVQLVEAVVSHQSNMLHRTIKQFNFRSRYDAAVVAVHRRGERIHDKIGSIRPKAGDILLMLVGRDFFNKSEHVHDFYLITPFESTPKMNKPKSRFVLFTMLVMILLAAFHIVSMFVAALLAVTVLLLSRLVAPDDLPRFIQLDVLILIACALAIGSALEQTGTAQWAANSLIALADGAHPLMFLGLIYLITNLFTEMITNSAAAIMMFPIAMAVSEQLGTDPTAFIMAVCIAASAGFATPIGYQTNTLVYGSGRYKFTDYVKVGLPLNVLYMFVSIALIWMLYL